MPITYDFTTFSSFFAFTWWVIKIKYNDLTKIKNSLNIKYYKTLSQLFLERCKSIPWRAIKGPKRNSSKINAVFITIKSLKWKLKTKLCLLTRLHFWLYVFSGKTWMPCTPLISWFLIKISRIARNVTAAMLVVKNKKTSLLGELNSIFV